MPRRTVALIAGASGSGKSRLARLTGWPVLRLDNFYRAETDPGMPLGTDGLIDWDDIRAWDANAASTAIVGLSSEGVVDVPIYDIAANAPRGQQTIDSGDAPAFVAEGIFASAVLAACREAGLPVVAIWLDRGRLMTWWRRLRRDVREHRKPLPVLLRRGVALSRAEPSLRRAAVTAGFTPMTMRQATINLKRIVSPLPDPAA